MTEKFSPQNCNIVRNSEHSASKKNLTSGTQVSNTFACLQSLGTKWFLHPLPTLQNKKPVPQVLKQVVNLSCYLWNPGFEMGFSPY